MKILVVPIIAKMIAKITTIPMTPETESMIENFFQGFVTFLTGDAFVSGFLFKSTSTLSGSMYCKEVKPEMCVAELCLLFETGSPFVVASN